MSNGLTRRERGITDLGEIERILAAAKYAHIGLVDGDEPYVVPMNYGYTLEDGHLTLYLHGALRGRKLDVIAKNPKVSFTLESDVRPFDGDVACRYGLSYRSVMGVGTATVVDDIEEKKHGLSVLMKTQTDGDFSFTDKMAAVVSVIRIDVTRYTAKLRPHPDDKR